MKPFVLPPIEARARASAPAGEAHGDGEQTFARTFAAQGDGEIRFIELARVRESPANTRKAFDQAQLEDLARSIAAQGVQDPILVRPTGKDGIHEVVYGHRRLRAAALAGLKVMPCRVRKLTDAEAQTAALVENLQREDLTALEESAGYAALMEAGALTAADVARQVGKGVRYVQQRIALADLIPPVKAALAKGQLAASAADEIARLLPEQQQQLWKAEGRWGNPTVDGIRRYIEREIQHRLDGAPWKRDDAELVPKAGACTVCPNNTANKGDLFGDLKHATCLNPECYQGKLKAHVARQIEAQKAQGVKPILVGDASQNDLAKRFGGARVLPSWQVQKAKGAPDGKTKLAAVVVDGAQAGQVITIAAPGKETIQRSAAERRQEALERAKRAKEALQAQARLALVLGIANKLPDLPKGMGGWFFRELVTRGWHGLRADARDPLAKALGFKVAIGEVKPGRLSLTGHVASLPEAELLRELCRLHLAPAACGYEWQWGQNRESLDKLYAAAGHVGIKGEAFLAAALKRLTAESTTKHTKGTKKHSE